MDKLRPIFPYLRHRVPRMAAGIVLVLLVNLVGMQVPRFVKDGIDALERHAAVEVLERAALLIVLAYLVRGTLQFLMRQTMIALAREVEYELRRDLFAHLLTLPPAWFDRNKTGDVVSRATNDVEAVRMLCGFSIAGLANTVFALTFALVGMCLISVRMALIAMVPLLALALLVKRSGERMHDLSKRAQEHLSRISARAQEAFSGVRVVKAFAREAAELRAFDGLSREYADANLDLVRTQAFAYAAMAMVAEAGVAVTLLVCGRGIIGGEFTKGDFIAFSAYQFMLLWPMTSLGWVLNLIQRGTASLGRVQEILSVPGEPPDAAGVDGRRVEGRIEFRGLTFGYGERPVLRDVSLVVPAGSSVAIVGRTGSGKSTLVSLVPRLYAPPRGTVFLDGMDVLDLGVSTLRTRVAMVPQDPFLFSDTVRGNIAFGRPDAAEDEVRLAARRARVEVDILGFTDGYAQRVGERGITVSGGQKQRMSIARALLMDPRVLILDDALSSVDAETEEAILTDLREVFRGRTVLLVSHRVSTVRLADRIVVLDEGRVVEEGTHAELLARGGLYAAMAERQALAEELDGGRPVA